jgi:hypothetical protein
MVGQTHTITVDVSTPTVVEKSELDCLLEYGESENACAEYGFRLDASTYP